MILNITESASKRIKEILDQNPNKVLRFGADSGGCSGFTYAMNLVDKNELSENDEKITDEIVVDGFSLFLVVGTTIDYKTDIMGSYFVFDNPNQVAGCGCGTSFSI